jgi:hypothetical protein
MLGGLGFSNAAASRALLSTLAGERYATERHRQHQHERRDQQRYALPHILTSSPFSPTRKPAYLSFTEIAGSALLAPPVPLGAHLWEAGFLASISANSG